MKRFIAKCENTVYDGHLCSRWYVLDTETKAQFNCNSHSHAIQKAGEMNRHWEMIVNV